MQRDTWIMLGTTIAMAALMVSIMVALFASTNARIDGLRGDLNSQIGRVDSRIDDLRADMREDHAAIHTRLDSLQDGLADVGQRLARVEGRLGMARADEADAGLQSEP